MAQFVPIHQKVAGLIPSEDTHLRYELDPWLGIFGRQPIAVSLACSLTLALILSLALLLFPFLSLSMSSCENLK